jgi:hypothetical protein
MASVMTSASTAQAYERQLGVFVGAGYTGIATTTPYPPHAVAASVGVGVGLSDVWEIRGHVDYGFHVAAMHRLGLGVDLVYLVDVLSVVPYLGVSVSGALALLDPSLAMGEVRGDFLAGGLAGLDVLLGREWTIGVEVRVNVGVTDFDRAGLLITGLCRAQALFEI